MMLLELLRSMRPHQWYKNLVVFVGIVFSLNLFNLEIWGDVLSAFLIFCLLSGSEYIINDVMDLEMDRHHPRKSRRPIASGRLGRSTALTASLVLISLSMAWAYAISLSFLAAATVYFLLALAYTFLLKHIVIVDVLVIASGFVIRAVAGCLAISVLVSPWLIICTFLLALFLALGKRRVEMTCMGEGAAACRKNLNDYSLVLVDQLMSITTASLIISYSLYTFLADTMTMMLTVPFAIYGLFRYLFLIYVKEAWDPEALLQDWGVVLDLLMWVTVVLFLLYRAA